MAGPLTGQENLAEQPTSPISDQGTGKAGELAKKGADMAKGAAKNMGKNLAKNAIKNAVRAAVHAVGHFIMWLFAPPLFIGEIICTIVFLIIVAYMIISGGLNQSLASDDLAQSNGAPASTVTGTRADLLAYARTFLGYPYVLGAEGPNSFDCSGFTKYVYAYFGIDLPHSSEEQWTKASDNGGTTYTDVSQAKPGDIVCYVGHVAILTEDKLTVIHAGSPSTGVNEGNTYQEAGGGKTLRGFVNYFGD